MKTIRPIGTIVLITGLALGLSACSGGGEIEPVSPPPSASANQINPVPRDLLQDGGSFTWPLDSMPANFNYYELDGLALDNHMVIAALIPSAFYHTADGTPVWNPDLLASEPELMTESQQVVIYRINPDAIWYDGSPITWEDFYWQWQACSGENPLYRNGSLNGYELIEMIERGANDREVIVTYGTPFADWPSLFDPLYPVSTNRDPEIFNDGWQERPLTTAGPFKLDTINVTAQTITLVRNEKWWGETAKLDTIVYRVINTDAQIDALANGEIDAMDIGPDANTYNRAGGIANVEIRTAGGPNFRHITINGTSPKLQDVRVRQALAMGIDRSIIARAILGPLGIAPEPLNNHVFMANQSGYQDNAGEIGQYNPQRTAELLDEAGWVLDGDVRRKDGEPLEITFVIPAAVPISRQEAELVQNLLGQLGVSVMINTVPINDFFERYVTPGQFDFTLFSWIGTPYPVSSIKSVYVNPTLNPDGQLDILQNYARVGSDEIDDLLNRAAQEFDRDRAIELANQADALIWQLVHSLTLYQRPELVAANRNLANFGAFGFARPWIYQDIGWMQSE